VLLKLLKRKSKPYLLIMKSIIASGLLLGMAHGAAIAGPYANIEANSGFYGSDYLGTATDVHVGFEGANWYVQGGPALLQPDGADGDIEVSAKAGASASLSDALSVYGEVSFITGDEYGYGTKVGAKYNF
jgi:hypothetical protein